MEKLISYLNGLSAQQQTDFATACGTTIGYLRKACSIKQLLGAGLCINIERESGRSVLCEDLRPDIDWAFIRNTKKAAA